MDLLQEGFRIKEEEKRQRKQVKTIIKILAKRRKAAMRKTRPIDIDTLYVLPEVRRARGRDTFSPTPPAAQTGLPYFPLETPAPILPTPIPGLPTIPPLLTTPPPTLREPWRTAIDPLPSPPQAPIRASPGLFTTRTPLPNTPAPEARFNFRPRRK